jgi:hypothetical protein
METTNTANQARPQDSFSGRRKSSIEEFCSTTIATSLSKNAAQDLENSAEDSDEDEL